MPTPITMPDGSVFQAPDGMSQEQMLQAAGQYWAQKQAMGQQIIQGKPQNQYGWGDALSDAVLNIPSSAYRAGKDIFNAVTSPLETAKAIGNTALGFGAKLIPGKQDSEVYADAMVKYFVDRYGGIENFKQSVATDPVGVLADLSTVFTGGAGAAKGLTSIASKGSKAANILGKAGNLAEMAARTTDPLYAAVRGAGKLADWGYGRGMTAAEKLYQSALKPSTAKYRTDELEAMRRAGVENRIPITARGVDKANGIIGDLNSQLDARIADVDAAGRKYDPYAVVDNVLNSKTRSDLAMQADPIADINAFDNSLMNYLDAHSAHDTIGDAQQIKKSIYNQHKTKYQNNTTDPHGKTAAQMEIARQLRQVVEDAVPEARSINRQEKALIGLRDEMERATARTGNHNPFSLIPTIFGSGLSAATGNIGAGAALAGLGSFFGTPGMKSRMSFLLDDMSKRGTPDLLRKAAASAYLSEQEKRGVKSLLSMIEHGQGEKK